MTKLHIMRSALVAAFVKTGEARISVQDALPFSPTASIHGVPDGEAGVRRRLDGRLLSSMALLVTILVGLLACPAAHAQNQPWCSRSSGATSCLYASPSECEQNIQAIGGDCIPNPYGVTPDQDASAGAPEDDGMPPPPGMGQAGGWMPYCSVVDGGMSCVYSDPASCEQVVQPEGGYCMPNPRRR